MKLFRFIYLLALCLTGRHVIYAQGRPVGTWRSLLPYNSAAGVATDGRKLYTVTNLAFFTFEGSVNGAMPEAFSKVEGMSDLGMQGIGYDQATATAILAYANGNIDLFKDNTFYNIPDLKLKTIAGSKTVYQVYTDNGYAYLASTMGVLVVDLAKHNIPATYQFVNSASASFETLPVYSFARLGDSFYAATPAGLYRANRNSPELQNFHIWERIDTTHVFKDLAVVNNQLFSSTGNAVFAFAGGTASLLYQSPTSIRHIDAGLQDLLVGEADTSGFRGQLKIMNSTYQFVDSFNCDERTVQAVQMLDNSIWVAAEGGLKKRTDVNQTGYFTPAGPSQASTFDIYPYNKTVYVALGGYDDLFHPLFNHNGVSYLENETWKSYRQYIYQPFDTLTDFCEVLRDESNGTLYMGSMFDGLFIHNKDESYELVKQNSILEVSSAYQTMGGRQVAGLALDNNHNLWVSTIFTNHQLYARTTDGNWYKFLIPGLGHGGPLAIDDNGQIWIAGLNGGGVGVYNYGSSIEDPSDDQYYFFTTGVGTGNLPSNTINCIAKDKKSEIWVGTNKGIAIISNCTPPYTPTCDAVLPIVKYDQYAGYLFANDNVRTIAVDGANRKWVGTDNGVWLLSADAQQIISRFTAANSPLPSDLIRKIAIDPITGDVYIGTELGLVSYRGTATDGGATNDHVVAFPNPVPANYEGTIAIKGLVADADVRITDISGQMVFRTKALGGQAVWNGKDYTGHRPQTGVYLVFSSNADGSQVYTGKIVFTQ